MEKNYAKLMAEYGLPAHMVGGVERYVEKGIAPGGFLTAVFSNDLMGAVGRADSDNLQALGNWAKFIYNELPSVCWRNEQVVAEWIRRGGMEGITAEKQMEG